VVQAVKIRAARIEGKQVGVESLEDSFPGQQRKVSAGAMGILPGNGAMCRENKRKLERILERRLWEHK